MSNEQYLVVSYSTTVFLAIALGGMASWFLYAPFRRVAQALCRDGLARWLGKGMPLSMIVLALSFCLGVSYTVEGCSSRSYQQVVSDRGFIVGKNLLQVSQAAEGIEIATLVWSVIALLLFVRCASSRRKQP